jgi:hypothetical protein
MKKKNTTIDDLAVMVQKGFDGVDLKFEQVDKRFDDMDKHFDKIEKLILADHKKKKKHFASFVIKIKTLCQPWRPTPSSCHFFHFTLHTNFYNFFFNKFT